MTPAETTATIITKARDAHGHGSAAFDWQVAGNTRLATQLIENSAWQVANPGGAANTAGIIDGAYAGFDIDRTKALLAEVASGLDAYRARCKARKYSGWSFGHPSQIRYA